MERLNSELADTLHDLIRMEARGEDVTMHMLDVMVKAAEGDLSVWRERQYLLELAEAGCVDIKVETGCTEVEGLTSRGRSYFKDLRESEERENRRIWSDRRFQIWLSLLTLALSTLAGWVAGHF